MRHLLVTVTILSLSLACSDKASKSQPLNQEANSSSVSIATPTPPPTPDSPIRRIDFDNMTYPPYPVYPKSDKPFKLTDGEYEGRTPEGAIVSYTLWLASVIYGDVTSDGQEEAIVILTERTQGIAIPYYVYIYTLKRGKPELLWAFQTGDRGDGGRKRISAESGDLVIELYGKNTFVDENLVDQEEGTPACCSHFYTRSRYHWTGNHFERIKAEVLPNPNGDETYPDPQ